MASRPTKNSILSAYFSEIRNYPLLTKEEEQNLARDIQKGNRAALNELVESNLSFVAKVAAEYRSLGMPFEDLLNEGNVGLIEAAQRFDASKDTKFISYAIWWIRKSILKALSEQSNVVRLPYSQMKKVKEIRAAEKHLRRVLGRKPDREEISEYLEKSLSKIDRVLQHGVLEVSLDEPVGEDQDTHLADCLVDRSHISMEEVLLDQEMTGGISEIFEHLSEQQQTVIQYRFGLNGQQPLTLQDTGREMGLSRERVRQIECQAKERMRKLFDKRRRINAGAKRPFRSMRSDKGEAVSN
ncbi:MAG: RNA polymerase sigma factor RpoD/SigA [bacterium]|nr:RNA polymerase sigma factor RpoD/SigA [bacterium]